MLCVAVTALVMLSCDAIASYVSVDPVVYTLITRTDKLSTINAVTVWVDGQDSTQGADSVFVSSTSSASVASVGNLSQVFTKTIVNATSVLITNTTATSSDTVFLHSIFNHSGHQFEDACFNNSVSEPPFGFNYKFAPIGLSVGTLGKRLVVTGRFPVVRLFGVQFALNYDVPTEYTTIVGSSCNASVAPAPFQNGTAAVSNGTWETTPPVNRSSIQYTRYSLTDDRTQTLYFSQPSCIAAMSSNGVLSVFFGDQNRVGTQDDLWNLNTTRWNATTSSPSQMALDVSANIMYVAESDMTTVRRIDLSTGAASVFLGILNQPYSWPPSANETNVEYHRENVTLLRPTAIAFYQAASEKWLFVGDATLAVVYKVVIDTGVTTIVAGTFLRFGWRDGGLGSNRLGYVCGLSAGATNLYIADGALRVMPLEGYIPKAPPTTYSPTEVGVATTAQVATSIVGVSSIASSPTEAVSLMIVSPISCNKHSGGPANVIETVFFLTSLDVGAAPWVLLAILGGFLSLHFIVSRGFFVIKVDAQKMTVDTRFPSFTIQLSEMIVPLAMFGSVKAVSTSQGAAAPIVSGVICALLCSMSPVVRWILRRSFVDGQARFCAVRITEDGKVNIVYQPLMETSMDAIAGSVEDPFAYSEEGSVVSPDSGGSGGSFGGSFSASFASLMGIEVKRVSPKQDTATKAVSPVIAAAVPPTFNCSGSGVAVSCCNVDGYWEPREVRLAFGALFAKVRPQYCRFAHLDVCLPLLTGLLSGVALQFAASDNLAVCSVSFAIIAAFYAFAAVIILYFRPYVLPSSNTLTPAYNILFVLICLLKGFAGDQIVLISIVQLAQTVLLVVKLIFNFYLGRIQHNLRNAVRMNTFAGEMGPYSPPEALAPYVPEARKVDPPLEVEVLPTAVPVAAPLPDAPTALQTVGLQQREFDDNFDL